MKLKVSTKESEGLYQGSKWLKYQVLCEAEELGELFNALESFEIFPLTGFVEGKPIEKAFFLHEYGEWISGLKEGRVPTDAALRRCLAAVLTDDPEALWLQEIPGKGYLVKVAKPLIQVQAHSFSYSKEDGEFRPMSMGSESVFWGLQFSFPQVYQDGKTLEFRDDFALGLFAKLRFWVREFTRATPFVVEGKRINSPIRVGKKTLSWVGNHPQLKQKGIGIYAN